MFQYQRVALEAAKSFPMFGCPVRAWKEAARRICETEASREKGCPRDTFLGLCQEGRVKGIPAGAYTRSVLNRDYAVKAVEILATGSTLQPIELWASINPGKTHNGQMDVVVALWDKGLIVM